MSYQLPDDCLNEIFEYLNYDRKTLYSLLLVNRFYCKVSIEILWRNIWRDIWYNRFKITHKQLQRVTTSILSTLFACLPKESKDLLFKNKIIISAPTSKPPLFNYPSFCNVLSIDLICRIINIGLEKTPITTISKEDKNYLVINEIIKLLVTRTSSFKELSYYDQLFYINFNECKFKPSRLSFTCFSGAIDCLKDLSELQCILDLPSEFFYHLSKISHNLYSLNIIIRYKGSKIPNELKELISLQNNLKNLSLSAYNKSDWTDIIPTLTKHSNTLTKLHLKSATNNNLSVSWISLFSNLQEIKFTYTTWKFEIQFKDFEKLQYANFPKLQYLSIPRRCTKLEHVEKFLENNGKNLKKFHTKESNFALNLSIAKFCPNLKKLFTIFMSSELGSLITIFNNCQHLESISIESKTIWLKVKDVLETITKYSPKNLYKLKIYDGLNSKLLPEGLESFFISWKSQTSFTLIIIKYYYYDDISLGKNEEDIKNMELIKKYKNLGIIKKFETIKCENKTLKIIFEV
ncbi:hypothetical protein C1645_830763 [Glomus cerebriforme]|uniref:F-box domain-containing protein n=1 Tax=Glomus cerebriforme TaxID=658196 RepID=A0A397SIL8_9GLOM|nr:hypothetical protein C1645_830763 [Glomus cerebriforme]